TRYSMNAFEPLYWMGSIYILLLVINRNQPKLLLWCGVLLGLGIENKHSTMFFIFALTLGLVAAQRGLVRTKWFWLAAGITVLLALPNFIWQVQHGYPTYVDLSNVKRMHKNVELHAWPVLKQQIMGLNPLSIAVWPAGLRFLLWARQARR